MINTIRYINFIYNISCGIIYLNEIYLGNRSYGVAAAALNYFGKSLYELTIE